MFIREGEEDEDEDKDKEVEEKEGDSSGQSKMKLNGNVRIFSNREGAPEQGDHDSKRFGVFFWLTVSHPLITHNYHFPLIYKSV